MIVTYLRSSSYSAWDWCQLRYYLEYVIGLKPPPGLSADKGNAAHKALEVLARKKLALQNGEKSFAEGESGREFSAESLEPDDAVEFGLWFYTQFKKTPHAWGRPDFDDVRRWTYAALEYNGGQFSPLKREIIQPEQYFDLQIEADWADFSYQTPSGPISGKFSIKGTVDLVVKGGENTIEYIDWKTGRRMDWATRKVKEYKDLQNDPQLLLYHYALSRLYPDADSIVVTVFFLKDGGPFSLCFGREDLARTERMLQKRFEQIRSTQTPSLNKGWKTCGLCNFSKDTQPGGSGTVCEHFEGELLSLGLDLVTEKYGKTGAFSSYGDGGGRAEKN